MNMQGFFERFPSETSCKDDFKIKREKEGIVCKGCSGFKHYWLKNKYQWQCKACKFRTTLRSGTIMENSNMSFKKWYLCMALMGMTKKGFSAKEMQRQLDHKRYEPIWLMMHKIRSSMGCRDSLYSLEGMVEFDEGYFTKGIRKGTKTKRGRGSQNMQNVAVIAESVPLENLDSGKKSSQCRYFKMKVQKDHSSENIDEVIQENLDDQTIVFSDKSTSYVNIADHVETHIQEKSDKEKAVTTLRWVHIAIGNAKRWLLGVHHMIKGKYLQNYLNEFCYKLNRRYFKNKMFDRITFAVAKSYWQACG